jgi:hypothetical protein
VAILFDTNIRIYYEFYQAFFIIIYTTEYKLGGYIIILQIYNMLEL